MPAAGIFFKVHVVDIETGNELQMSHDQVVSSQSTGLTTKFRGKMAVVEQMLTFKTPIRLALENNVALLIEIFVPKLQRYSSCYARMSMGKNKRF